jgi:hypothetical protein
MENNNSNMRYVLAASWPEDDGQLLRLATRNIGSAHHDSQEEAIESATLLAPSMFEKLIGSRGKAGNPTRMSALHVLRAECWPSGDCKGTCFDPEEVTIVLTIKNPRHRA